jgi:hypothetical protein
MFAVFFLRIISRSALLIMSGCVKRLELGE